MEVQFIHTREGWVAAAWQDGQLAGLTLPCINQEDALATLADYVKLRPDLLKNGVVNLTVTQEHLATGLEQYFAGKPVTFNLPISWQMVTPFQQKVLKVVATIPYGQSLTYGEIAKIIENPKGSRAVGGAVGANPWLLVVPCHRVLARERGLGGFSSGLAWKRRLLTIEGIAYKE